MDPIPTAPSTAQTTEQPNDTPSTETSLTPTALTTNNSIITLRANRASFQIRLSLLPRSSRFFAAALTPPYPTCTSTGTPTVDLVRFSFDAVRLYADCLYEARLIDLPCMGCPYQGCCPSSAATTIKTHHLINLLVDAHVLAEEVQDHEFATVVAATLQSAVWATPGYFPCLSTIELVFGSTEPGSALRRLFCDVVRRWLAGSGHRFLEEILAGRGREGEVVSVVRRTEGENERYQRNRMAR